MRAFRVEINQIRGGAIAVSDVGGDAQILATVIGQRSWAQRQHTKSHGQPQDSPQERLDERPKNGAAVSVRGETAKQIIDSRKLSILCHYEIESAGVDTSAGIILSYLV